MEDAVIDKMRKARFRGRKINVEIANPKPKGRGGFHKRKGRKGRR